MGISNSLPGLDGHARSLYISSIQAGPDELHISSRLSAWAGWTIVSPEDRPDWMSYDQQSCTRLSFRENCEISIGWIILQSGSKTVLYEDISGI